MIKALVPIAEGSEEIEAVSIVDTFRRADWQVTVAAVDCHEQIVTCSRGVKISPDQSWSSVQSDIFDVIAIPGGIGGTDRLSSASSLLDALKIHNKKQKMIGAMCAGPLVLQKAGLLAGRHITCHPAVRKQMNDVTISNLRVVIDNNIVTSQGPGTAIEFALAIIRIKDGDTKADAIARAMIVAST